MLLEGPFFLVYISSDVSSTFLLMVALKVVTAFLLVFSHAVRGSLREKGPPDCTPNKYHHLVPVPCTAIQFLALPSNITTA